MAFLSFHNVSIRGIAGCVPRHTEENKGLSILKEGEDDSIISMTGIERRHVVDDSTTCSDLCVKAFDKLIEDLGWERSTVDAIGYISMTHDHLQPPTACLLQKRLGLSEDCYALDMNQGCPGWLIGLSTMASLVNSGGIKRAVLLNGDINSKLCSPYDTEIRPLFSDAGVATALEYNEEAPNMEFHIGTRGDDKAIIVEDGGIVNPLTSESFEWKIGDDGIKRMAFHSKMDGMSVFSFGISAAPKSVKSLCEHYGIEYENVDKFFFHNANHFMNEKIRKKLKIDESKVPYILRDFGNASSASIPLNIILNGECENNTLQNCVACAFGVGLQWGSVHFVLDHIVCPPLIMC